MLQSAIRDTDLFAIKTYGRKNYYIITQNQRSDGTNQQHCKVILQKVREYWNNIHKNLSYLEHEVGAMQKIEEPDIIINIEKGLNAMVDSATGNNGITKYFIEEEEG